MTIALLVPNDAGNAMPAGEVHLFTTTSATPQVITMTAVDPIIPTPLAYMVRIEWTAVGSGSVSAGVSYAAYYDNTSAITLIGSSSPLAAGPATLTCSTTGARSMQFSFQGLSSQTLSWTVRFFTYRQQ
jgi:hypothetical protein